MARDPDKGRLRRLRPWVVVYAGATAVLGVIAGIVWNRVVSLPSYVIGADYRATIAESALAGIAATDVWLALLGVAGGAILGTTAWILFRRLGPVVTLIAVAGAAAAGVLARLVGEFLGPSNFAARIAQATRGEFVHIDFTAHTWASLFIWIGVAAVPVLVGALIQRREWIALAPAADKAPESP